MRELHQRQEDFRTTELPSLKIHIPLPAIWGFLIGVLATIAVTSSDWFNRDFLDSLAPEAIGILVTILVIDQLNRQNARREYKRRLIHEMGSRVHEIAIRATEQMKTAGWLQDGSLKNAADEGITFKEGRLFGTYLEQADLRGFDLRGADLASANLQDAKMGDALLQDADLSGSNLGKANLAGAKLQRANLFGANLQNADLYQAFLVQANLTNANLQDAYLEDTDLTRANFWCANLQGANVEQASMESTLLDNADLKGADLRNAFLRKARLRHTNLQSAKLGFANLEAANLTDANLRDAEWFEYTWVDDDTILPNGEKWTEKYDRTRFTNPNHPDFWEPEWVKKQRESSNT